MAQLRAIILYFLIIGGIVIGLIYHIDEERAAYHDQDLLPSLKSATRAYEGLVEQRLAQLEDFARDLERTDLVVYLDALHDFRGAIREVGNKRREAFPGMRRPTEAMEQRLKSFVQDAAGEEIETFRTVLDATVQDVPEGISRKDYIAKLGDILVSCMAEQEPWDVCYFKLTYLPLSLTLFGKLAEFYEDRLPQLFLLVDEDGQTGRIDIRNLSSLLRGDKDTDLYREATQYDAHRMQSFDRYVPQIEALRTSDDPSASVLFSDSQKKTYLAVVRRLMGKTGGVRGYVVVGFEVDEVLSKRDTRAVMGVRPRLEHCEQYRFAGEANIDDAVLSEESCEYEAGLQVGAVTYLYRSSAGSMEVRGSSLAGTGGEEIARMVSSNPGAPVVVSDQYLVGPVEIGLDYAKPGEQLVAALTVDRRNAERFYDGVCLWTILVGILVFLVGVVLMIWMTRASRLPYEEIDAAVHEIISGNLSHQIPFHFREELPNSLGQSLSVMRAVLLGEPLPEDQETDESWAAGLIVVGGDGPDDVDEETGESLKAEPEIVKEKDLKETRTEYYQRVYKEFLDAKRQLGEDISTITFTSFVDRLVRTEKGLRERFGCKSVRFRVELKNKQVALIPLRIIE
ncbi:MAG: MXAN_5187 C-terminal domain-containing protein [Pseudomonadota bacterium]